MRIAHRLRWEIHRCIDVLRLSQKLHRIVVGEGEGGVCIHQSLQQPTNPIISPLVSG